MYGRAAAREGVGNVGEERTEALQSMFLARPRRLDAAAVTSLGTWGATEL
jgi:hypothetical protein